MGHRDDLLVTRQYTRMTNAAGGPPTRSVCLLGFVQVGNTYNGRGLWRGRRSYPLGRYVGLSVAISCASRRPDGLPLRRQPTDIERDTSFLPESGLGRKKTAPQQRPASVVMQKGCWRRDLTCENTKRDAWSLSNHISVQPWTHFGRRARFLSPV